jgi:hypothetical protein
MGRYRAAVNRAESRRNFRGTDLCEISSRDATPSPRRFEFESDSAVILDPFRVVGIALVPVAARGTSAGRPKRRRIRCATGALFNQRMRRSASGSGRAIGDLTTHVMRDAAGTQHPM